MSLQATRQSIILIGTSTAHLCRRTYSTKLSKPPVDLTFLSKPSWSVRSLLPASTPTAAISRTTLHHLLRLSSLPAPSSPSEEETMLADLSSQLHFVNHIQSLDTSDVSPLTMLRDETEVKEFTFEEVLSAAGLKEEDLGNAEVMNSIAKGENEAQGDFQWDVLGQAKRKAGRYFVVDEKVRDAANGGKHTA